MITSCNIPLRAILSLIFGLIARLTISAFLSFWLQFTTSNNDSRDWSLASVHTLIHTTRFVDLGRQSHLVHWIPISASMPEESRILRVQVCTNPSQLIFSLSCDFVSFHSPLWHMICFCALIRNSVTTLETFFDVAGICVVMFFFQHDIGGNPRRSCACCSSKDISGSFKMR